MQKCTVHNTTCNKCNAMEYRIAQYSATQCSTYSTVHCSTYSTVELSSYSTVQYGSRQYRTVRWRKVQCSTYSTARTEQHVQYLHMPSPLYPPHTRNFHLEFVIPILINRCIRCFKCKHFINLLARTVRHRNRTLQI